MNGKPLSDLRTNGGHDANMFDCRRPAAPSVAFDDRVTAAQEAILQQAVGRLSELPLWLQVELSAKVAGSLAVAATVGRQTDEDASPAPEPEECERLLSRALSRYVPRARLSILSAYLQGLADTCRQQDQVSGMVASDCTFSNRATAPEKVILQQVVGTLSALPLWLQVDLLAKLLGALSARALEAMAISKLKCNRGSGK